MKRNPASRTSPSRRSSSVASAHARRGPLGGGDGSVDRPSICTRRRLRFAVACLHQPDARPSGHHHTLEEYFSVKRRLFTDFEVGARVVNSTILRNRLRVNRGRADGRPLGGGCGPCRERGAELDGTSSRSLRPRARGSCACPRRWFQREQRAGCGRDVRCHWPRPG